MWICWLYNAFVTTGTLWLTFLNVNKIFFIALNHNSIHRRHILYAGVIYCPQVSYLVPAVKTICGGPENKMTEKVPEKSQCRWLHLYQKLDTQALTEVPPVRSCLSFQTWKVFKSPIFVRAELQLTSVDMNDIKESESQSVEMFDYFERHSWEKSVVKVTLPNIWRSHTSERYHWRLCFDQWTIFCTFIICIKKTCQRAFLCVEASFWESIFWYGYDE